MSYEPPLDDPWSLDTEELEIEPLEDRMFDETIYDLWDYNVSIPVPVTPYTAKFFIPANSSPPF